MPSLCLPQFGRHRSFSRLSVLNAVGEMPYTSIGMVHMDPPNPIPYWDRTMMLRDFPKEAIDTFVARVRD